MSIANRMRHDGVGDPDPGGYCPLSQWDTLSDEERDQILFALLQRLNLSAYRVNDGNTVYVVVEADT